MPSTRLIRRVRIDYHWTSPLILFDLLVEFTDIIMMRKCLLGIKQRAEQARRAGAGHIGRDGAGMLRSLGAGS